MKPRHARTFDAHRQHFADVGKTLAGFGLPDIESLLDRLPGSCGCRHLVSHAFDREALDNVVGQNIAVHARFTQEVLRCLVAKPIAVAVKMLKQLCELMRTVPGQKPAETAVTFDRIQHQDRVAPD